MRSPSATLRLVGSRVGTGRTQALRAHVVSYADDFVILSRRKPHKAWANEALAWTRGVMAKLGLTINEAKTSVKDARIERFDFLGYTFGPHWGSRGGRVCPGSRPSQKSIGRVKKRVSGILVAGNPGTWDEVRDELNAALRGWSVYFSYGWRLKAYRAVDWHVTERVRGFLTRRHKDRGRGYRQFPDRRIHGELRVVRLFQSGAKRKPWALT